MIDHKRLTALAMAVLFATMACSTGAGAVVSLPEDLAGRWETSAPQYADRYLQLSSDNLVIGTGPASAEVYEIDRVLRLEDDDGVLYTIEYSDQDGVEYNIGFYFDPKDGGTLRMRNQLDKVWRKVR